MTPVIPIVTATVPATATTIPVLATATPVPAATAVVTTTATLVVHNQRRTVVGGRTTPCDLAGNTNGAIEDGCEIVSSVWVPGATVNYTLSFSDGSTLTFNDTADARGHSLHPFAIAYHPAGGHFRVGPLGSLYQGFGDRPRRHDGRSYDGSLRRRQASTVPASERLSVGVRRPGKPYFYMPCLHPGRP